PAKIKWIITKCWSKERKKRPTFGEVEEMLAKLDAEEWGFERMFKTALASGKALGGEALDQRDQLELESQLQQELQFQQKPQLNKRSLVNNCLEVYAEVERLMDSCTSTNVKNSVEKMTTFMDGVSGLEIDNDTRESSLWMKKLTNLKRQLNMLLEVFQYYHRTDKWNNMEAS
ncbi:unnamed protein product, partial [Choristocarpus tenellus]